MEIDIQQLQMFKKVFDLFFCKTDGRILCIWYPESYFTIHTTQNIKMEMAVMLKNQIKHSCSFSSCIFWSLA